jgi:hypothetical protein
MARSLGPLGWLMSAEELAALILEGGVMADEKRQTVQTPAGAPPVVTGGTDIPGAGGQPKPPPKPEEPDPEDDEPAKK